MTLASAEKEMAGVLTFFLERDPWFQNWKGAPSVGRNGYC